MYEYKATVTRLLDADTIELSIDLGFYITIRQLVRLDGIDAPERYTTAGKAAIAFVTALIPPGTEVVAATEKAISNDKFGRYLARIRFWHGTNVRVNTDLTEYLIANGHGVPYDGGKRGNYEEEAT